jgi:putative transposase
MSELYQSLSHSRWNCKYHVVLVPKRRRQKLFGEIRRQLGPIFHELARQKDCRIIEGHVRRITFLWASRCRPNTLWPRSLA